jgi:hypothetical protein
MKLWFDLVKNQCEVTLGRGRRTDAKKRKYALA